MAHLPTAHYRPEIKFSEQSTPKNRKVIAERFAYKCGQLHWTIIGRYHELTQRYSETVKPLSFGTELEYVLSVSKRGKDAYTISP